MKKYLLLLLLLTWGITRATAQKVVLSQNPALDSIPRKFGPNLKYYAHFYVGYGFMAGEAEGDGSKIRYGVSHEWLMGLRFKYKLAEFLAVGLEANLNPQTFYLKQQEGKTLPNTFLNDMEKLKFTNLGLAAFARINYDKRGNYMGNFIDIGVYGNYLPFSAHIYRDRILPAIPPVAPPATGAKKTKVRETGLQYVSDFNYGVMARAGFNRYVFYANYRLSDIFDSKYVVLNYEGKNLFAFDELPRLTVGFQLSMHK